MRFGRGGEGVALGVVDVEGVVVGVVLGVVVGVVLGVVVGAVLKVVGVVVGVSVDDGVVEGVVLELEVLSDGVKVELGVVVDEGVVVEDGVEVVLSDVVLEVEMRHGPALTAGSKAAARTAQREVQRILAINERMNQR